MKKPIWLLTLEELHCRFQDDEIPALAAQLTFYLILAFFPFLIFLLTLLSYTPITEESFLHNLSSLLPKTAYSVIHITAQEIVKGRSTTLLSFGMLTALWSASNGVNSIIRALNKAYDEEETRSFIRLRGMSIIFTVLLALIILVSLILILFGERMGTYLFSSMGLGHWFNFLSVWLRYLILASSFLIILLFLYKYMPNRRLSFSQVLPGAIFSVVFWIILSLGFSSYVNNLGKYNKMYGSIGGIIVLLLWIYISSIVILLGGELNGTLIFSKEGRIKPICKKFSLSLFHFNKDQ